MPHLFALFPALFFATLAPALESTPVRSQHTEATLISEVSSVQSGQSFTLALRLKMEPHWHTYWLNPGDSGLATSIDWTLPPGFQAEPITWPYPHPLSLPPLMSYGYEDEVWLLTKINAPANLSAGNSIEIQAGVKWLECREVCIPGKAALRLTLPVETSAGAIPAPLAAAFTKARALWPQPFPDNQLQVKSAPLGLTLLFPKNSPFLSSQKVLRFFPEQDGLLEEAATQKFSEAPDGYALQLIRTPNNPELPKNLRGVLVITEPKNKSISPVAYQIDYAFPALAASPAGAPDLTENPVMPKKVTTTIWFALFSAFVGGLILNLMPCVLPVLSLKVLHFVESAKKAGHSPLLSGVSFTAGVLVSFWILAIALLVLRAGGEQLGWGFQLQNPKIVAVLCCLFTVIALNLFGVFEIGASLMGLAAANRGSGWAASFWSGVLATIVATPCTAPFMGTALGFALGQPPAISLLIFTALGLGMAAPYLILSGSPALLRFLPKPGAWMETFKQFMGFPMLATVLWLIAVYHDQKGMEAVGSLLIGLLLLGLAAWLYGRFSSPIRPTGTRIAATIVALAIALAGLGTALPMSAKTEENSASTTSAWEKFDPARVRELRTRGTPVFIDFTATWCLTCQVNKRVALHDIAVEKKFRELGVITMIADWTLQDPIITAALAEFGRDSVPLYVLYGPDATQPPQTLPELLTPDLVLQALERISPNKIKPEKPGEN